MSLVLAYSMVPFQWRKVWKLVFIILVWWEDCLVVFWLVVRLAINMREAPICDILLNQSVFAGVGNIIKNEALFNGKVHPLSIAGKIPKTKLETIARAAREFSMLFY
jgi:endonuclease-8